MRENKETFIDFYTGAWGPTIIINIQDIEWLKEFRTSVAKLGQNELQTINLLDGKIIKGDGISQMIICKGNYHNLALAKKPKNAFIWTLNNQKIKDIMDCCEALINENTSGHYFFYDEKPATIEFSYNEQINI